MIQVHMSILWIDEIMFAQLHGLSDHLTYSLKDMNYKVYKYMPFG